jgi:hypothetical protein
MKRVIIGRAGVFALAFAFATGCAAEASTVEAEEHEPEEQAGVGLVHDPIGSVGNLATSAERPIQIKRIGNTPKGCGGCGPVPDPWQSVLGPVPDPWHRRNNGGRDGGGSNGSASGAGETPKP